MVKSIYDIKINSIDGKSLNLGDFKNKKIMIVNVASACGFTKQYEQLQDLYDQNLEKLVILGCPCNDFGGQEPGNSEEIQSFCKLNFGVTFPLTQKVGILNDRHELFDWLMKSESNQVKDFEVTWNFYKFCINEDGSLENCYSSTVDPLDENILTWINS